MSFAQEINVMKNLRHDNIVRYLGIQLEDKCLNIFLEYVGESRKGSRGSKISTGTLLEALSVHCWASS